MPDTVQPKPTTYVAVSTDARLATANVTKWDGATSVLKASYVAVSVNAHLRTEGGEQASWTAAFTAPTASDLLALLAPVVDQLRQMAADELVAPTLDEFIESAIADVVENR